MGFEKLAQLRDALPAGEKKVAKPSKALVNPWDVKLVVSKEKKGHGGKTVTRITGFTVAPARVADLAQEMKKSLGTGGDAQLEDGVPVIQLAGDIVDRVVAWLEKKGAKHIVRGSK